jgi:AP-3 complex subunit beta
MLSVLPDKIGKAFGTGTLAISQNKGNRLAELINSKYTEDLVEAIRILYAVYITFN